MAGPGAWGACPRGVYDSEADTRACQTLGEGRSVPHGGVTLERYDLGEVISCPFPPFPHLQHGGGAGSEGLFGGLHEATGQEWRTVPRAESCSHLDSRVSRWAFRTWRGPCLAPGGLFLQAGP